jgi:hypothetical protein
MIIRYRAEWISGYNGEENDEFDPDLYEIDSMSFAKRGDAEEHAERMAKHCDEDSEWWYVIEEVWTKHYAERIRGWYQGLEPPIEYRT